MVIKAMGAIFNYQNNGLVVNNGKITAYYGAFTKNVTVFMSKNLIAVEDVTTPLRQVACAITSLSRWVLEMMIWQRVLKNIQH